MAEQVKLNLGCGTTLPSGWVGYDNSPNLLVSKIPGCRWLLNKVGIVSEFHYRIKWPRNARYRDVGKHGLPHRDNTVDVIYMSHFLEHLERREAEEMLRECLRVLTPGRICRVVVPDLYVMACAYVERARRWVPARENEKVPADEFMEALRTHKRRRRRGAKHEWMYDAKSLTCIMLKVGFVDVRELAFQCSHIGDIQEVEKREEGIFVEGRRPG